MTAEELTTKLLKHEDLFILDVRNPLDYDNWKIEGGKIDSLNIPYFDLLDEVAALEQIPEGKDMLVVCAKEGSSKFIAERLTEAGKSGVYSLKAE